jgi:hypothetical protein
LQHRVVAIACIGLAVAAAWRVSPAVADEPVQGTASRAARQQALSAIPFDQINAQTAQQIRAVVQQASVYRRLPITAIESDPDLYLFLVRYPEVVVDIWRMMGVSQMTAKRTGQFALAADDGSGTTSNVDLIYGTPNLHVYFCDGEYNGPRILRPIKAKCVIVLQSQYVRGPDGKPITTSCLDVFLDIENAAADWVAKTIHPLFGGTADNNFVESLKFVEKLSRTTIENGPGVQGMSRKLINVHPEVRARFAQIAGVVYDRYAGASSMPAGAVAAPIRQSNYQSTSAVQMSDLPGR